MSPQFEQRDYSETRYERVIEKVRHIKELKPKFSFLEIDYFLHTVYEKPSVVINLRVSKPNNISESTKIDQLKNLLKSKPQIILANPPNTSKTYISFQLISLFRNEKFLIKKIQLIPYLNCLACNSTLQLILFKTRLKSYEILSSSIQVIATRFHKCN